MKFLKQLSWPWSRWTQSCWVGGTLRWVPNRTINLKFLFKQLYDRELFFLFCCFCLQDAEKLSVDLLYPCQYLLHVCVCVRATWVLSSSCVYLSSNLNVSVCDVMLPHCHTVCFRSSFSLGAAEGVFIWGGLFSVRDVLMMGCAWLVFAWPPQLQHRYHKKKNCFF